MRDDLPIGVTWRVQGEDTKMGENVTRDPATTRLAVVSSRDDTRVGYRFGRVFFACSDSPVSLFVHWLLCQ